MRSLACLVAVCALVFSATAVHADSAPVVRIHKVQDAAMDVFAGAGIAAAPDVSVRPRIIVTPKTSISFGFKGPAIKPVARLVPSRPIVQRSHRSKLTSTVGWVCWDELVFDAERVSGWLSELSRLPGARRAKAVLHTNEGWWGFNYADGIEAVRPSGYRRDSRLEVVIEGEQFPNTAMLEEKLHGCLETPVCLGVG